MLSSLDGGEGVSGVIGSEQTNDILRPKTVPSIGNEPSDADQFVLTDNDIVGEKDQDPQLRDEKESSDEILSSINSMLTSSSGVTNVIGNWKRNGRWRFAIRRIDRRKNPFFLADKVDDLARNI